MQRWTWVMIIVLPGLFACRSDDRVAERKPEATQGGTPAPAAPAWRYLFDGTTLTNWILTGPDGSWGVEEGGILAIKKPGEGHVRTAESFGDFELQCEFRIDAGADTGVFFHWTDPSEPATSALEIQLTDVGPPGLTPESGGALAGLAAPRQDALRPAGEWNDFALRSAGDEVAVTINGKVVLEVAIAPSTVSATSAEASPSPARVAVGNRPRRGYLGFQNNRFFAWFRGIRVRTLEDPDARNR